MSKQTSSTGPARGATPAGGATSASGDASASAPFVMAHMIPFFPDLPRSRRVVQGLIDGGAAYLEIQFAYSDPTADGPSIQGATATALREGFTVAAGWEFVREITRGGTAGASGASPPGTSVTPRAGEPPAGDSASPPAGSPPVFVMSYAGLVYARGIDRFVARTAELGVEGVIVPDLPLDSDEGLLEAGRRHGVNIVPVIALGASPERIALVHRAESRYIYASLRRGITGTHTTIGPENTAFLDELGSRGARVLAGFGISTAEQVRAVTAHAHAAVVGSAFVRAVEDATAHDPQADPYQTVRDQTLRLTGRFG
jgi:tryptophan synthase alpha chain